MISSAKRDELTIAKEALDVGVRLLERQRVQPNFGNAGAAINLITSAKKVAHLIVAPDLASL